MRGPAAVLHPPLPLQDLFAGARAREPKKNPRRVPEILVGLQADPANPRAPAALLTHDSNRGPFPF